MVLCFKNIFNYLFESLEKNMSRKYTNTSKAASSSFQRISPNQR
nr:MAG TPA: hypothetical protein [Caudoviricetes sp.]